MRRLVLITLRGQEVGGGGGRGCCHHGLDSELLQVHNEDIRGFG